MGDASGSNITPPDFFGQRKKRSRTEQENYITPTQSNSDLTSDDNTSTSVFGTSLPTIQLNSEEIQGNASIETVVSPSQMDKEKERLVFKLDKLNDKRCRYESHETFLKKCIDNNLIPNGPYSWSPRSGIATTRSYTNGTNA